MFALPHTSAHQAPSLFWTRKIPFQGPIVHVGIISYIWYKAAARDEKLRVYPFAYKIMIEFGPSRPWRAGWQDEWEQRDNDDMSLGSGDREDDFWRESEEG